VVVPVDWTQDELLKIQRQVIDTLVNVGAHGVSASTYVAKGVVEAGLSYLVPEWINALATKFAGERICISGEDPALMPSEGPQPQSGDGWRLLADQDETGYPYRTGIAYDKASYRTLWDRIGLSGDRPEVDFDKEIVLWFGAVHGSSCPRLRLDDVVVDADRSLVHGQITELDWGMCTADAMPHAYVVALDRDRLPHGPFAIQLGADDPPYGAPEERTVVDVDLSAPGSTATPGQIHGGGSIP
jgi:hypothetical protein